MNRNDISAFAQYCRRVLELDSVDLSSEYGYPSVPLCVIDAVFSIGVRYASTRNTVAKFCEFFDIPHSSEVFPPEPALQLKVSDFIKLYNEHGVEAMAEKVYRNKQRTSSRKGILKSEAVLRFCEVLSGFGVEYLQDVSKVLGDIDFETEIMQIPGQRSSISLRYFYMLAGSENFIKPDRMINRFAKQASGKTYDADEITKLIIEACELLAEEYPGLTPRTLDNLIWQYQRRQ